MEIYNTSKMVGILVEKGTKSEYDFLVRYKEPKKRMRTPKHMHLVFDIYMKKEGNRTEAMLLVDHIIDMIPKLKPATSFPPKLQLFSTKQVKKFSTLEGHGEYSIEFLLVVLELILIQEKTNYPDGTLSIDLFNKIRNDADIFSVVSAATFNKR